MQQSQLECQVRGLSTLLSLQSKIQRAASLQEVRYRIVNDTALLLPYRQALLCEPGTGKVRAVSDLPEPDANAPFVIWAGMLAARLAMDAPDGGRIDPRTLPEELRREWDDWFPAHAVRFPLRHLRHGDQGALLLVRDMPFSDEELTLGAHLAETYALGLGSFTSHGLELRRRIHDLLRRRRVVLGLAALLVAALCLFRVHLSAVGTCELVADAPAVLRSPLNGVVGEVLVRPNETVRAGQTLLRLDDRDLLSRLLLARKALETAQAEYRQVSQSALLEAESKWQLNMAQAMVEERREQLDYIEELLDRTEVAAPRDGIAIFNDPDELIGVPVQVGQRLMEVCGERESALRIWLPVDEAVDLQPGATIRVFLNVDPEQPVPARLTEAAFTAEPSPLGILSYRLRAEFAADTERPRIGMRGLALVQGERVSLCYYLLRRPYAAVRRWLGW